jgi:hypothetical protein
MGDPSRSPRTEETLTGPADMKDLYLNQLDQRSGKDPGAERRRYERVGHRVSDGLEVIFVGPDGQQTTGRVRPRNLSRGGAAFLHDAFVFPDTHCTIMLWSLTGQLVEVSGEVVDCRHIQGKLHEIAVSFDQPITPSDFEDCVGD